MGIQLQLNKGRVPVKIWTQDIDATALRQLLNVANLPVIAGHIAAMPDVHAGVGATVGAVIPTVNAIIPAAVGVDIGCGMNAVRLSLNANQLPSRLGDLRAAIEAAVPVGSGQHGARTWREAACLPFEAGLAPLLAKHPKLATRVPRFQQTWARQMGSLGGGNHFIELCLDESQHVWVMLHSGSRAVGNAIGQYFIDAARRDMERQQLQLPDKDLAYVVEGSTLFADYLQAVGWAQDYALANRRELMSLTLAALQPFVPPFTVTDEAINCHHNYVSREEHFGQWLYITRKGAIRAGRGELGIVPGSMGSPSFIVRGLGNAQAYCSCAHGAGRRMSRSAAREQFSRRDLEQQTRGVECRKDSRVIDEIPGAYKDIHRVMQQQDDLVEVVHTLQQVLCVKG